MESTNQHPLLDDKSPGQQLRELRQAAGLTVAYVAERMHLHEDYINALEADDFDQLPPQPYVLGYYRSYARLLNIQSEPLLRRYRKLRHLPEDALPPPSELSTKELYRKPMVLDRNPRLGGRKGSGRSLYLLLALALAGVWLGSIQLAKKNEEVVTEPAPEGAAVELAVPVTPEPEAEVEPLPEAPEELSAAAQEAESEFDIEIPAEIAVDASESAADADAEIAAEPDSALPEQVAQVRDQLNFSFSDECWLEVTDANGDILAATLYQNGDTAQLTGVAPFVVMMGNVRAVQLQLNGEAVEMRPLEGRKTLRMTLDKPKSTAE